MAWCTLCFFMGGGVPDPEVPPKSQLNIEMTKSPNNPYIHAESRFFNQSIKSRNPPKILRNPPIPIQNTKIRDPTHLKSRNPCSRWPNPASRNTLCHPHPSSLGLHVDLGIHLLVGLISFT